MEAQMKSLLLLCLLLFAELPAFSQGWLDNVEKDIKKTKEDNGVSVLQKADAGDAEAQWEIYKMDTKKNVKYKQMAIAQDYIPALRSSGKKEHLIRAARLGDEWSIERLGSMIVNDFDIIFTPLELNNVLTLVEKQVKEKRNKVRAYFLANMFLEGKRGEKNLEKGMEWMELSANWGYDNAKMYLFKAQRLEGEIKLDDVDVKYPKTEIVNSKTFVLIFVNEKYIDGTEVKHAINDGRIFRAYCNNTLGIPLKNIRFTENATFNDYKANLQWASQVAEAFDGEVHIIFYYAGLGYTTDKENQTYLLPADGSIEDRKSLIELPAIYESIGKYKTAIVILDACFNGRDRNGKLLASARGVAVKQQIKKPTGHILTISASSNDETAFAYNEKKHGMFTYYLLKALQQPANSTNWGSLVDKVRLNVKQNSLKVLNHQQTPAIYITDSSNAWRTWKLIK